MAGRHGKEKKSRRVYLPGMMMPLRREDKFPNTLQSDTASAGPDTSEFCIRQVKAIQECGHGEDTRKAMNNIADESQCPLSPVSEHGKEGRDHFRNKSSAPLNLENNIRKFSSSSREKDINSFYLTDNGLNDPNINVNVAQDVEQNLTAVEQQNNIGTLQFNISPTQLMSSDGIDNTQPESPCMNILPANNEKMDTPATDERIQKDSVEPCPSNASSYVVSDDSDQDTDTSCFNHELKIPENLNQVSAPSCLNQELTTSKNSNDDGSDTSSYVVPELTSSVFGSESFLDRILSMSLKSHSDRSDKLSHLGARLEELSRAMHSNPDELLNADWDSESVKALINSLIKATQRFEGKDCRDLTIPSLNSYVLLQNETNGKCSLIDAKTFQLPFSMNTDEELKCVLESQCLDIHCSTPNCIKCKEYLLNLQDEKTSVNQLTDEELRLLWYMYRHCCSCQSLHCPVYWCDKSTSNWPPDVNIIFTRMKQVIENGYHSNFLKEVEGGTFSPNFDSDDLPSEWKDWQGLCRMLGANNTIFAQGDMDGHEEYWIIKKISLYENLRQLSHKGIVPHLWAVFGKKHMVVCTRFEEFSLFESLKETAIKNLETVVKIMLQLIDTTHFLHDKGILYLNWSSRNILFNSWKPTQFQLTNFTCSVLKSRLAEDIEDVTRSLPLHLLAPEMMKTNPEADELSDIWGLGCLLKEIFTGEPMWYEYHHKSADFIRQKIKDGKPNTPVECIALFSIFRACWEKNRSLRPCPEELQILLVKAANSGQPIIDVFDYLATKNWPLNMWKYMQDDALFYKTDWYTDMGKREAECENLLDIMTMYELYDLIREILPKNQSHIYECHLHCQFP